MEKREGGREGGREAGREAGIQKGDNECIEGVEGNRRTLPRSDGKPCMPLNKQGGENTYLPGW